MDGQIGTGGPRIKLGNVNGSIKVTHAQDGLPLSPGTSLQGESRTIRVERMEVDADDVDRAAAAAEAARIRIETGRVAQEARQAQRDAQRKVDIAMREAQSEIERAQRDLQREQARTRVNRSRGAGMGAGQGEGSGRFTAQETRTFTVSGAPRVSITTFDGRVTVHGWDKSEVTYTATKHASQEESLKQISIDAQQQGQSITVNAKNDEEESGSVDLDVYVPRQSTLHVSSGDGALNLEGVSGQITLRSGDGSIHVANSGGQLDVNTGDGHIQVTKFDGQVDARTGDGEIALDGNFNALSARTGDGQITLSVPAGSSFTIETNAPDEISNEGFIVAEDITPSPRLKRWRIGNGGKVFVLKTGEGKILLRPRN
jgi:DUF4097 and DUF4098 domain-containing protein YvlB